MLPRARLMECDVKPSLVHFDHSHQPSQEPVKNITALLDELFIVLYDPKDIVKLKVPQMHYCQQVPMRLRRLPKSFFSPVSSYSSMAANIRSPNDSQLLLSKHHPPGKCRMKSLGPPGHHFEYCCQTKSIQSTPTPSAIPPESKNNFVISNNHISFIEGHQYDARMYASIEVTATTLKYQKTLQLPSQSNSALKPQSGSFLPPANFCPPSSGANWDGSSHYQQMHPNQSNAWLNYQRAQYESSHSGSETETEPNETDKSGNNSNSTSHGADYLDLDGFDSAVEYVHPTTLESNSSHVPSADLYGSTYHIGPSSSHSEQSSFVAYSGKPIVTEYTGYPLPAPQTQPHQTIDQLVNKEPSSEHSHLLINCDQLPQSSYSPTVSQFGAHATNLWNPSSWN